MRCTSAHELRSLTATTHRPSSVRKRVIQVKAVGEKLQDWVRSPALLATFGPRATLGALLTAPERLSQLPSDISKVQEVLSGPSSANEKANILLEEAELRLVDCLERGATVESDIYQNLRSMLPEQVQQSFPETSPFIPNIPKPTEARTEPEETVTYTSESVAQEKLTSETSGLSDAIIAVRTAQSALRTNISQAREKMLKMNLAEERQFLQNILSEIDVGSKGMDELVKKAQDLLKETEDMT